MSGDQVRAEQRNQQVLRVLTLFGMNRINRQEAESLIGEIKGD